MAFKLGSTTINKTYLGSTLINKLYLGSNLVYGLPNDLLRPVLSNFHMKDDNLSAIYFDSSEILDHTITDATGFDVPYRSEISITIIEGALTGHFLTVSSPHSYWNITTIRYDGTGTIADALGNKVHAFTLEHVDNQISEPAAATIRYANATGSGLQDGTSEANAWSYAAMDSAATSGMTVYVKAGQSSDQLNFSQNGTAVAPIKFIGYKSTPGDITSNYYTYGDALNNAEMPTLIGSARDSGEGMDVYGQQFIIIKNFNVGNYQYGVQGWNTQATNIVFERCNFKDFGTAATSGYGMNFNQLSTNKIQVKDCTVGNASQTAVYMAGSNNLIKDSIIWSNEGDGTDLEMDYYALMEGSNTVCYNTQAIAVGARTLKSGQGLVFKASPTLTPVEYSLIQNCTVTNIGAPVEFRWSGTKYCVAKGTTIDGAGGCLFTGGLRFREGCSFNIFENGTIKNVKDDKNGFIGFLDNTEEGSGQNIEGNIVRNTLVVGGGANQDATAIAIKFGFDRNGTEDAPWTCLNNKIQNCTFKNIPEMYNLNSTITITNFELTNCIIDDIPVRYNGNVPTINETYNDHWDFWGTNGVAESGTGNISVNPVLDASYQPQADFRDIDVSLISGIYYDKNGTERSLRSTTVGAISSSGEDAASQPFIYTPQAGGSVVYLDVNAPDDLGDGSIGNPYQDIELTLITGTTRLSAGDVLVIRGGTYPTTVMLSLPPARSTLAERIVIQSYPTERVVIDATSITFQQPTNPSYLEGVLSLYGGRDYDIVDGIEIHNSAKIGFYVNNQHTSILNCKTYHTGSSGIYLGATGFTTVDNNEIELGTYLGYQEMLTAYSSHDVVISNNHVHNGGNENAHSNGLGIDLKDGCYNIEVVDNTVHDVGSHGIYVDSRGNSNNIEIHRNKVYNASANAITIATEDWTLGDPIANDIQIYNNVIYDIVLHGIRIGYSSRTYNYFYNIDIVNNTIYNTGGAGILYYFDSDVNHTANSIRISNNIIRTTGIDYPAFDPIMEEANSSPVVTVDTDTNIIDRDQGAKGLNAIVSDPLFVDETNKNLRLQIESPAIDTGIESISIYQPIVDYAKVSRVFNSTIDIGAFENTDPYGVELLDVTSFTLGTGITRNGTELSFNTTDNDSAYQLGLIINGNVRFTYRVISHVRGAPYINIVGGTAVGVQPLDITIGTHVIDYNSGSNNTQFYIYGGQFGVGGEVVIDDISLKEIR